MFRHEHVIDQDRLHLNSKSDAISIRRETAYRCLSLPTLACIDLSPCCCCAIRGSERDI